MRQRPKEAPRDDMEAGAGATVWGPFHVPSACGFSGPLFPECLPPPRHLSRVHQPHTIPISSPGKVADGDF